MVQFTASDMMKKKDIAKTFDLSEATVQKLTREIEEEIIKGRYARQAVIRDGKLLLINVVVFMDYLTNRRMLKEKNARKYVKPFDYETSRQYLGIREKEAV